jgi:prepilin-type N-terminal cleavage/methylation domain-containing protein/prepilin-type processing-associated H-X9-DG protein
MRSSVNHPQHTQRGFSLVELLVVITIITLLISLLLPALSTARSLSQSSSCLSNVRQLAVAYSEYCVANNPRGWLYDLGGWEIELTPFLETPGAPSPTGPFSGSNASWNSGYFSTAIPDAPVSYVPASVTKLCICPSTQIWPWGANQQGGFYPGFQEDWSNSVAGTEAWGRVPSNGANSLANNSIPLVGSYAFNAWLYNAYDASDQNTNDYYYAFNDTTDGTKSQLWYGYAGGENGLVRRSYGYADTNSSGYSGINTQTRYLLNWTTSAQSPPPNVPVFCDGSFAETTPMPEDPPNPANNEYGVMDNATGTIGAVGSSPSVSLGTFTSSPYGATAGYYAPSNTNFTDATGMFRVAINRHNNMTVNVGFVDGHAESESLGNLWTLPWASQPAGFTKPANIVAP